MPRQWVTRWEHRPTQINRKKSRRYCDGGSHRFTSTVKGNYWHGWISIVVKGFAHAFCPAHQERSLIDDYLRRLRKKKTLKAS